MPGLDAGSDRQRGARSEPLEPRSVTTPASVRDPNGSADLARVIIQATRSIDVEHMTENIFGASLDQKIDFNHENCFLLKQLSHEDDHSVRVSKEPDKSMALDPHDRLRDATDTCSHCNGALDYLHVNNVCSRSCRERAQCSDRMHGGSCFHKKSVPGVFRRRDRSTQRHPFVWRVSDPQSVAAACRRFETHRLRAHASAHAGDVRTFCRSLLHGC